MAPRSLDTRRVSRGVASILASLVIATLLIAASEGLLGVPNASPIYVAAVVVAAMTGGTIAGFITAVAAVLTYDLLFTAPALTLQVTDPAEVLDLLLLSFVGITVGQLVAIQRRRATEAVEREREAQDLYAISRSLASRSSTGDALVAIAGILAERTGLERIWIGLGPDPEHEQVLADTGTGPQPVSASMALLKRSPARPAGDWVVIHAPGPRRPAGGSGLLRHRVVVEAGGATLGSIWGIRLRSSPPPDPTANRLLAATADQVGQAVHQDRLAARAAEARVARESDALKSALVESVSHDLRIPLASIRAAAGPLIEPAATLSADEVCSAATVIDREAARLDRLVADLLDLGRVQAGMLRVHLEAVELREVIQRVLDGLEDAMGGTDAKAAVEMMVAETWVDADPLLLQQAVQNVLENSVRHTPPRTGVRITADPTEDPALVRLTIEDAGPGVSPEALPRLFDRFFRAAPRSSTRRRGSGVGLAVARGFIEAMGGRISARPSELGGLAIDIVLPAMTMPGDLATGG